MPVSTPQKGASYYKIDADKVDSIRNSLIDMLTYTDGINELPTTQLKFRLAVLHSMLRSLHENYFMHSDHFTPLT